MTKQTSSSSSITFPLVTSSMDCCGSGLGTSMLFILPPRKPWHRILHILNHQMRWDERNTFLSVVLVDVHDDDGWWSVFLVDATIWPHSWNSGDGCSFDWGGSAPVLTVVSQVRRDAVVTSHSGWLSKCRLVTCGYRKCHFRSTPVSLYSTALFSLLKVAFRVVSMKCLISLFWLFWCCRCWNYRSQLHYNLKSRYESNVRIRSLATGYR